MIFLRKITYLFDFIQCELGFIHSFMHTNNLFMFDNFKSNLLVNIIFFASSFNFKK